MSSTISFEALFLGQVLGTVVFVIGLVLGGFTPVTFAGGAIILLSVAGLAFAAFRDERHEQSEDERADRTDLSVGR